MDSLDLRTALREMKGRWRGAEARARGTFTGVSTDTRSLRPGQLFFALKGEHFDGHDFVELASRAGAAACVVGESRGNADLSAAPGPLITVDDPLAALERVALWHRRSLSAHVTAITGSVGKTTTKEFLSTLLSRRARVAAAPKSFNNRLGVALTVLSADQHTEQLIVEIGTSGPGEIAHLSRLVRPHRTLVTKIAPAHLRDLKDLDGVIEAKAEILEGQSADGVTYLNCDLPGFERFARRAPGELRTFGWNRGDFAVTGCIWQGRLRADRIRRERNGSGTHRAGYHFLIAGEPMFLPVLGKHNVINAAASIAVARDLGCPWEDIRRGLTECRLPPQRLQYETAGGITFIDDSYNANPASLEAAIEVWEELPLEEGRKVVVLGDMLELGDESRRLHEQLGRRLARVRVDVLVTVGEESRYLARAFEEEQEQRTCCGSPEAWHFDEALAACRHLETALLPGDQVLFKGSNGVGLNVVACRLRRWARDTNGGAEPST